jgi:Uma2 family endonuclease
MTPPERNPWIARFPVERCRKMLDAGIFSDMRIELVDEILFEKPQPGPEHAAALDHIRWCLHALPTTWRLWYAPFVVLPTSLTEPDFVVARSGDGVAEGRYLQAAVGGLVIEVVSNPSKWYLSDKARIYARGGVVCYWIVNLDERRVEVHTQPSGPCDSPAYVSVVNYSPPDAVPLILDGVQVATIPVADLLP